MGEEEQRRDLSVRKRNWVGNKGEQEVTYEAIKREYNFKKGDKNNNVYKEAV